MKQRNVAVTKDLDETVLKILESAEDGGISKSELAKYLKIPQTDLEKLINRLSRKGLIKKEKVKNKNKDDLIIYLAKPKPKSLLINLDTAIKVPCFTCKYIKECGENKEWRPASCEIINMWLEQEYQKSRKEGSSTGH